MVRCGLALLAALCLYLLAAIFGALLPGPVAQIEAGAEGPPVEIRLIAGPIHYDVLLPLTPETRTTFADLGKAGLPLEHPQARWLVIGWGSRAFYTHEGSYAAVPPATLWRAVTGDSAVIRADVAGEMPEGLAVPALSLTAAQYKALLEVLASDLIRGADGAPRALAAPGFTDWDIFFEARGRFHILRTCNTWVSRSLRRAGVRFGRWTPTPYSITLSHWWFHTP